MEILKLSTVKILDHMILYDEGPCRVFSIPGLYPLSSRSATPVCDNLSPDTARCPLGEGGQNQLLLRTSTVQKLKSFFKSKLSNYVLKKYFRFMKRYKEQ